MDHWAETRSVLTKTVLFSLKFLWCLAKLLSYHHHHHHHHHHVPEELGVFPVP